MKGITQDGRNLVPGSKVSLSKTKGLFYLTADEFIRQSGQMKKSNPAKQDMGLELKIYFMPPHSYIQEAVDILQKRTPFTGQWNFLFLSP